MGYMKNYSSNLHVKLILIYGICQQKNWDSRRLVVSHRLYKSIWIQHRNVIGFYFFPPVICSTELTEIDVHFVLFFFFDHELKSQIKTCDFPRCWSLFNQLKMTHLPLLPTPCAPNTAIFTSESEDFFRRIPRVVIFVESASSPFTVHNSQLFFVFLSLDECY